MGVCHAAVMMFALPSRLTVVISTVIFGKYTLRSCFGVSTTVLPTSSGLGSVLMVFTIC